MITSAEKTTAPEPVSIPKPGLVTIPLTEPVWEAANEGTLLIQRCRDCGHAQHYPRNICVTCWSDDLVWEAASGLGKIWTFTVVWLPGHPGWKAEAPYVLALVELDEGPRMMTNIIGCEPDDVAVGQRVYLSPSPTGPGGQMLLTFALSAD